MGGNNKRHRVVIIGAGLGGLTAAAFLQRYGIDVHVYERAPELKEVGAGINLDSNATRVLYRLGITEEELLKVAVPLKEVWEFKNGDDDQVRYSEPFRKEFGAPHVVIHRGDLHNLLKKRVSQDAITTGHGCVKVEQFNDGVEITFDNGATVEADIVIGADGIRSVVRNAVVDIPPKIRFWTAAYRALVPIDKVPPSERVPNRTAWLGPRHFFMRYPVSGGKLINIIACVPRRKWEFDSWVVDAKAEDFLAEFDGWNENIKAMIGAVSETKLWGLHDMDPIERWSNNRVTLLGDAAHGPLPFLGQGAAQAMEDAEVLAGHLRYVTKDSDIPVLFNRYEALRKPRATMVQFTARTIWNFIDPPGTDPQDLNIPGDDIFNAYKGLFNMHEWLNGYQLERDGVI
jgi:salicylate hydroxylase